MEGGREGREGRRKGGREREGGREGGREGEGSGMKSKKLISQFEYSIAYQHKQFINRHRSQLKTNMQEMCM